MPHARRKPPLAAAAALVAMLSALAVFPVPDRVQANAGVVGYDISWPQCGNAYPAGAFGFAIVGVTGGRPYTANSCLSTEYQWARGTGLPPALYLNVDFWDGSLASATTGPAGTCAATDYPCLAYNYGWNGGWAGVQYARSQGVPPSTGVWWLDVETSNNWSGDQVANTRSVQGALDALTALHMTAGVYSTSYQWGVITGGAVLNTYGASLPLWVAGAGSLDSAPLYCSPSHGFSRGVPWLVQYPTTDPSGIQFDGDLACLTQAGWPAPPRPPLTPAKEITLTRRADGNTDLFIRGTDGGAWHAAADAHGHPTAPWEPLHGTVAGAPIGSWFNGELNVFAAGSDQRAYEDTWAGGWSGWHLVGGGGRTMPVQSEEITVTRRVDGTLDLFVRGADFGGWHMHADQHGAPLNGWEPLGGPLQGDPVGVWTGSTLRVFAIGVDHSLYTTAYSGGWSGSWRPLGGTSASRATEHVTVAMRASATMDLFVVGSDGAIWHAPTDVSGTPIFWESCGGALLGPGWASWGLQNQLDVVAVGTDGRPYGKEYAGSWSGWSLVPGGGVAG